MYFDLYSKIKEAHMMGTQSHIFFLTQFTDDYEGFL